MLDYSCMYPCFPCSSSIFWCLAAIVSGDTADEVYGNVKEVIQDQAGPTVWVPALDRLLWWNCSGAPYTVSQRCCRTDGGRISITVSSYLLRFFLFATRMFFFLLRTPQQTIKFQSTDFIYVLFCSFCGYVSMFLSPLLRFYQRHPFYDVSRDLT